MADFMMDSFLDELFTMIEGMVVKDKKTADAYETLESLKDSNEYLAALEGRLNFKDLIIRSNVLFDLGFTIPEVEAALANKYSILESSRSSVVTAHREFIIEDYVETNPYYFKLNGKPSSVDEYCYIRQEVYGVDITKPVHEMTLSEINLLNLNGLISDLKDKYPKREYLKFLGSDSISILDARKAKAFGILKLPGTTSDEMVSKFKAYYYQYSRYVLGRIYSKAIGGITEYYDGVMGMMILFMTVQRMISSYKLTVIKRDFYDANLIKNIYESYGVKYYEDIPLFYHRKLIKNLNSLLSMKGTNQVIIDICKLFGYDDVNVFKYYLVKEHKRDENGKFIFEYKTVDGQQVEDADNMYSLHISQVAMDEANIDTAIRDTSLYLDYDTITGNDPYWGYEIGKDTLKSEILKKSFNYEQTKYMAINSMYDITSLMFELNYFFRIILDSKDTTEKLNFKIIKISQTDEFNIFDMVVLLFALFCVRFNMTGEIISDPLSVSKIYGFNLKANITELNNLITSAGFKPSDFGVDKFKTQSSDFLLPSEVIDLFFNNKVVYTTLSDKMHKSTNYKEYMLMKKIYDVLMSSTSTSEIYRKSNGEIASTYSDFLLDRNPTLYAYFIGLQDDPDTKDAKIVEAIETVLYGFEDYFNTDRFKYLFSNMPSGTSDDIKYYIFKVIDFFKSYDVEINSLNQIYVFEDPILNYVKFFDEIDRVSNIEKQSTFGVTDVLTRYKALIHEDNLSFIDEIDLSKGFTWTDIISFLDSISKTKYFEDIVSINTEYNDDLTVSKTIILEDAMTANDNLIF